MGMAAHCRAAKDCNQAALYEPARRSVVQAGTVHTFARCGAPTQPSQRFQAVQAVLLFSDKLAGARSHCTINSIANAPAAGKSRELAATMMRTLAQRLGRVAGGCPAVADGAAVLQRGAALAPLERWRSYSSSNDDESTSASTPADAAAAMPPSSSRSIGSTARPSRLQTKEWRSWIDTKLDNTLGGEANARNQSPPLSAAACLVCWHPANLPLHSLQARQTAPQQPQHSPQLQQPRWRDAAPLPLPQPVHRRHRRRQRQGRQGAREASSWSSRSTASLHHHDQQRMPRCQRV